MRRPGVGRRAESFGLRYTIEKSAAGEAASGGRENLNGRETEIKLKISDVPAFHRALEAHRSAPAGPGTSKVHEEKCEFSIPRRVTCQAGQLLRIRTETPEVLGSRRRRTETARGVDLQAADGANHRRRGGNCISWVIQVREGLRSRSLKPESDKDFSKLG